MTVVGKILVFLILLLSLVMAALLAMFHITQTNWYTGYQQLKERHDAAVKEADTARTERDTALKTADQSVKDVQAEIAKIQEKLNATEKELVARTAERDADRAKLKEKDAGNTFASTDIERRKDEVEQYQKNMLARDERIKALTEDNNNFRQRAIQAEITARSLEARNKDLVDKLEDRERELIKARSTGGTTGDPRLTRNPPLENVEGLVTRTDPSHNLLMLSIGGDAGLVKGNTLEVFRLNPAKYLGTIRIVEVTPHEAVGQPVDRLLAQPERGDRVASTILPK